MNIIDIIIVIVLALNALDGLRKGLILSAFNLLGIIISIYISRKYYHIVSKYLINNTNIYNWIYEKVYPKVINMMNDEGLISLDTLMKFIKLPEIIKNGNLEDIDYNSAHIIVESITILLVNIISMISIFIVISIILTITVQVINIFFKLPVLNLFNRGLGLIFGITKGVLIIFIIYAILTPVITLNSDGFIAEKTNESQLGYFFYNNNFIVGYLKDNGYIE